MVHDPRLVFNVRDVVSFLGGSAVQSKTGHLFMKQAMRESRAIYGGRYRHITISVTSIIAIVAYSWLIICELQNNKKLSEIVDERIEK